MTRSVQMSNAKSRSKLMQSRKNHARHRTLPSAARQPRPRRIFSVRRHRCGTSETRCQQTCARDEKLHPCIHLQLQYHLLLGYTLAWQTEWNVWGTALDTQLSVKTHLRSQLDMVAATIQPMFRAAAMPRLRRQSPRALTATRKTTQPQIVG